MDRVDVLDWNSRFTLATVSLNVAALPRGVGPVGSKDLPNSSIAVAPSAAPTHANNTMSQTIHASLVGPLAGLARTP